ncbi:unnamed protein product [Gongylonema pulchrum]|uniref:Nudix hydrolase domain-containing protein n=1 Tax=Gongylonema pulchrum TaxID=637853 RepID=A0A183EP70_9BILA|nr:unnamed protein product [Gongylonema pulchrum]
MNTLRSRYSNAACSHRFTFDEQLREKFCERLRQPSNTVHPRYQIQRAANKKRDSAVLVPLVHSEGTPSILFTHRSMLLPDHRGEVCFPGGRMEPGETYEQAALRETEEEIGLNADRVEIWGKLRPVLTRHFTSTVTPCVGLVREADLSDIRAGCDEVQTVLAAPVEELCSRQFYTHFKRALRETEEEIGLNADRVEIWGKLRPVLTRHFTSTVTPCVGLVREADLSDIRAGCDEVQTVLAAPVEELCSRQFYTHFKRGKNFLGKKWYCSWLLIV